MMRFRKRFHRRKRRLPETFTIKECRQCFNIYGKAPCSDPQTDVFPLLAMATPKNGISDATELASGSDKFITFDGAKFQSLWFHDPLTTQDCSQPNPANPNASALAFILTIWEAIMVLPLVQGSQFTPAYLPNLTGTALQNGDVADRVLWKRQTHLFVQGVHSLAGAGLSFVYNPDTSARYQTESPVHVKSRARLDDRHAVFMVRNFVHDIFLPFSPNPLGCTIDCDSCDSNNSSPTCGLLPVVNDMWMKLFYHTRK